VSITGNVEHLPYIGAKYKYTSVQNWKRGTPPIIGVNINTHVKYRFIKCMTIPGFTFYKIWVKYKFIVSITGYLEHIPIIVSNMNFLSVHNWIRGALPITLGLNVPLSISHILMWGFFNQSNIALLLLQGYSVHIIETSISGHVYAICEFQGGPAILLTSTLNVLVPYNWRFC
jgi:hypothetical protein